MRKAFDCRIGVFTIAFIGIMSLYDANASSLVTGKIATENGTAIDAKVYFKNVSFSDRDTTINVSDNDFQIALEDGFYHIRVTQRNHIDFEILNQEVLGETGLSDIILEATPLHRTIDGYYKLSPTDKIYIGDTLRIMSGATLDYGDQRLINYGTVLIEKNPAEQIKFIADAYQEYPKAIFPVEKHLLLEIDTLRYNNLYFENVNHYHNFAGYNIGKSLEFHNCTFTGSSGISTSYINVLINQSNMYDIQDNFILARNNHGDISIVNSIVSDSYLYNDETNNPMAYGLIHIESEGKVNIINSIFCNNTAHVMAIAHAHEINVTNSIFYNNEGNTIKTTTWLKKAKDMNKMMFWGELNAYNSIFIDNNVDHFINKLPKNLSHNLFWNNGNILGSEHVPNLGVAFKQNPNGDTVDVYNNLFYELDYSCDQSLVSSVLLDAGIENDIMIDTDFEGNPRLYMSYSDRTTQQYGVDIGPFEKQTLLSVDSENGQSELKAQIIGNMLNLPEYISVNSSDITIIDIKGGIIDGSIYQESDNGLNVSLLNSGVYIVKINTNGKIYTQKFIKVK